MEAVKMERESIMSFQEKFDTIANEVEKQIIGQKEIIKNILISIIAGGNVLMEGAPGLGKTALVKTFSTVLDLPFSRIQFTPDLMPADILGTEMIHKREGEIIFQFQKGPIFSSLILADEINRATPKTQSAMLEAMQEKSVTIAGKTYPLPEPFFVLATQNPLEMEGTYVLPEAQLDRFMFKIYIDLPRAEDLLKIMDLTVGASQGQRIRKQISAEELLEMKKIATQVPMAGDIKEKVIHIMMESHPTHTKIQAVKDYVKGGASPRAAQGMIVGAKLRALSKGRYHVSMEDIRTMAFLCMGHRIFLNYRAMTDKIDSRTIIKTILEKVD